MSGWDVEGARVTRLPDVVFPPERLLPPAVLGLRRPNLGRPFEPAKVFSGGEYVAEQDVLPLIGGDNMAVGAGGCGGLATLPLRCFCCCFRFCMDLIEESSLLGIAIIKGVEDGLSDNEGVVEELSGCDGCVPLTVTRRFLGDGEFVVEVSSCGICLG